jgi:zinc/manganese transport system permease protein
MTHEFPWWVLPSAAALILVATHTYLGLHVISRNVFFVDLALAQVAALGSTVAYLYGFEIGDSVTYYVSLSFAVFGAWFFSAARVPHNRVSQEAIIGLAFAVASAGAILLSAENPHGAEHLRDMMAGSILVVSADEVKHAAVLYGVIGLFHWVFRRKLLLVSMDREEAKRQGLRVQLWDFLFYLSFAVIITSSVRIAGVLLVFILLIAPAVCGAMFATGIRGRLAIGWGCGVLATTFGLMLSLQMDWPPAPAISCIFALILICSAAVGNIVLAENKAWALVRFLGVGALLIGAGFGLTTFLRSDLAWSWKLGADGATHARADAAHADSLHSHGEAEHPSGDSRADLLAALDDEHEQVRASAAEKLGRLKDASVVPRLVLALRDRSPAVKEKAAQALGTLGRPEAAGPLRAALGTRDADEWVSLRAAEALVRCGGADGMSALLAMARDADAKLVRIEALHLALVFAARPQPASLDGAGGEAARAQLAAFWTANEASARWDGAAGHFVVGR